MLFNSIPFAIFLPIVFTLYWILQKRLRLQNLLVLVASYIFYGWWDWRFLSLIVISSATDYWIGKGLSRATSLPIRRSLLFGSIGVNLGLLGFFKYFDFFSSSLASLVSTQFGYQLSWVSLDIVLPVGISFYTFQTLSYTIDVYRGKTDAVRDPIAFFAYVSFFPQLVAGPIERASNLLPQFVRPRKMDADKAVDGLRQILWGLFKKVVVADNCGVFADAAFSNPEGLPGSTLLFGVFFFAFQIYGDFSGYSDIAIGTARLFGFSLMRNFAFPYFSRDIAEFWRRWHISLSSWFRDYLYIPLGGSRVPKPRAVFNIMLVFAVSGLWHGANWTFVVWGVLNGLYFLPLFLIERNRQHLKIVAEDRVLPTLREVLQVGVTFSLTLLAWIFFRADSLTSAVVYLRRLFSSSLLSEPSFGTGTLLSICLLVGWEWVQRREEHGLAVERFHPAARRVAYLFLISVVLWNFGSEQSFIYFQF